MKPLSLCPCDGRSMFYNQQLGVKEKERRLTDYSRGGDSHDVARSGEEAAQYIRHVRTLGTQFSFRGKTGVNV